MEKEAKAIWPSERKTSRTQSITEKEKTRVSWVKLAATRTSAPVDNMKSSALKELKGSENMFSDDLIHLAVKYQKNIFSEPFGLFKAKYLIMFIGHKVRVDLRFTHLL